jgi:hypothetical protein
MSKIRERCYAELEPALAEINRLVMSAPLDQRERVVLACCVAGYMFGTVAGALELDPKGHAREIANVIADTMEKQKH